MAAAATPCARRPPRCPPRARRRPGPRLAPAGRARRGDRPPDHRGERQADQVGPRRGRPRGVRCSAGPPRRPAASAARCSASTPTPPRTGRLALRPPRAARARCWHRAVQLPAQPGGPQGRPGDRGRRARSSSSPRPATPLSALLLGELLAETDLPAGMFSRAAGAQRPRRRPWSQDPRLPVISFTGSGPVGYAIMDAVPRKHVTLELGGNAAAVVADFGRRGPRLGGDPRSRTFANYQARPVLHRRAAGDRRRTSVYDAFADQARRRPSRRRSPATPRTTRPTSARWSSEDAAERVEQLGRRGRRGRGARC